MLVSVRQASPVRGSRGLNGQEMADRCGLCADNSARRGWCSEVGNNRGGGRAAVLMDGSETAH